jgi:hypothetical protein
MDGGSEEHDNEKAESHSDVQINDSDARMLDDNREQVSTPESLCGKATDLERVARSGPIVRDLTGQQDGFWLDGALTSEKVMAANPTETTGDRDSNETSALKDVNNPVEEHRPAKLITLRIPPGFNPEEYSPKMVTNTGGFRWRYLPNSSISQRQSMDEVIHDYVKFTKEKYKFDRANNPHGIAHNYAGRYEFLIHPSERRAWRQDRRRVPPSPIVHGIWDRRGPRGHDNRVAGMTWFYEGENGEEIEKFVAKEFVDEYGNHGTRLEKEIEGISTEDQVAGSHSEQAISRKLNSLREIPGGDRAMATATATAIATRIATATATPSTRINLKVSHPHPHPHDRRSTNEKSNPTPPIPSAWAGTSKSFSGSKLASKKRKAQEMEDLSVTRGRKRRSMKAVNYANDGGESDDDYCP